MDISLQKRSRVGQVRFFGHHLLLPIMATNAIYGNMGIHESSLSSLEMFLHDGFSTVVIYLLHPLSGFVPHPFHGHSLFVPLVFHKCYLFVPRRFTICSPNDSQTFHKCSTKMEKVLDSQVVETKCQTTVYSIWMSRIDTGVLHLLYIYAMERLHFSGKVL